MMYSENNSVCFSNNTQILQYKITISCYFSSTKPKIVQQGKTMILVEKQYLYSQTGSHKHKFAINLHS